MISPEFSTGVTLLLYGLASVSGIAGMMSRSPFWRRVCCYLAAAGFIFQTISLATGFHKALPDGLSLGAYLQLMAWFVVLCGLASWGKFKQEASLIFASPLGLMLFAMSAPYLQAVVEVPHYLKAPFYALHIATLFLSLALMALAFAAGSLFLFLEARIKSKQYMKGFWQDMPALAMLDKINAFATVVAYPLYTLGIVSGLIWAKPVFGATVTGDPKEVISIVIWLLFSVLFNNRLTKGWRGRKPARLAVYIFILCLFSIIVVNTFMETHHAFIRR